ncbi:MAG: 2-oxo-4-hydroxy-4-carboxy-5-ureidoimidazoline decarboxylase [Streptosporangiaceae bacterium]
MSAPVDGPAGEPGGLGWLNGLPEAEARRPLLACCSAGRWVDGVAAGRPFPSLTALIELSNKVVAGLAVADLRAALDGHPRIGDAAGERKHGDWSRREQAGVAGSDEAVRRGLAEGNAAYERRFGHIYLVCAAGRSGAELLAVLQARLGNDAETEWGVVRAELGKINALRLSKLAGGPG